MLPPGWRRAFASQQHKLGDPSQTGRHQIPSWLDGFKTKKPKILPALCTPRFGAPLRILRGVKKPYVAYPCSRCGVYKKLCNFKFSRCSKAVSKVSVKQFLTATCSRSVALRRKEVSKRACAKHRAKPDNREKRRAYEALPKVRAAHRLGEQRYRERKAMKSRRSS